MRGAVRVLCSNELVAPQSSETVAKLRAKHPEYNGEVFEEIKLEGALPLTEVQDVVRAIRSFPLSYSRGISGLRPRLDLISFTWGDSATRLLKTIAELVDVIKGGKVWSEVAKILVSASLTALLKGENDVRPIAVGIVWRRLAGKIACSDIRQRLVHAVRQFCTAGHKESMALVKFDFKNY